MANIIKGNDLMVFTKIGKGTVHSLAFATSHQLTLTADAAEISTKDHGKYKAKEITGVSWSMSTDNLYTVSTFNELFEAWTNGTLVQVYFTLKNNTELAGNPATVNLPGDTNDTWHPSTTEEGFYGQAYITSLSATAASGDNATFSATFDGVGKIVKGVYGAVEQQVNGVTTEIHAPKVGESNDSTFEKASGTYDSNETYWVLSSTGDVMVKADVSSSDFASTKQILYVEKTTPQVGS